MFSETLSKLTLTSKSCIDLGFLRCIPNLKSLTVRTSKRTDNMPIRKVHLRPSLLSTSLTHITVSLYHSGLSMLWLLHFLRFVPCLNSLTLKNFMMLDVQYALWMRLPESLTKLATLNMSHVCATLNEIFIFLRCFPHLKFLSVQNFVLACDAIVGSYLLRESPGKMHGFKYKNAMKSISLSTLLRCLPFLKSVVINAGNEAINEQARDEASAEICSVESESSESIEGHSFESQRNKFDREFIKRYKASPLISDQITEMVLSGLCVKYGGFFLPLNYRFLQPKRSVILTSLNLMPAIQSISLGISVIPEVDRVLTSNHSIKNVTFFRDNYHRVDVPVLIKFLRCMVRLQSIILKEVSLISACREQSKLLSPSLTNVEMISENALYREQNVHAFVIFLKCLPCLKSVLIVNVSLVHKCAHQLPLLWWTLSDVTISSSKHKSRYIELSLPSIITFLASIPYLKRVSLKGVSIRDEVYTCPVLISR